MCTVFAESEVVSLVAHDTPTADIIHGLDESVARKTSSLAKRVNAEAPYLMTGGVANNQGRCKRRWKMS
ncbi:MAG: BadF/BadG/BcrA/BcrD ATPase family protein [Atopobiaceae bacterium]